ASGEFGLIPRKCQHRGADLSYGFVEGEGLRCHYHGWKYDLSGACIERPFDQSVNPDRKFVAQGAVGYLVREKVGMLWVYMGPMPAPELPDWDVFNWPNCWRQVIISEIPCNWLQCQENTVDPVHFEWLHNNTQQARLGLDGPFTPPTIKMAVEDAPF